jgi:hypothetical protein
VLRTQGRADYVVSTLGYIVVAPSGRQGGTVVGGATTLPVDHGNFGGRRDAVILWPAGESTGTLSRPPQCGHTP